ncbi:unnamed protein product [Rhizophagus irregularis]|nr:unnamed protein product [Rhizophagus irregularis]
MASDIKFQSLEELDELLAFTQQIKYLADFIEESVNKKLDQDETEKTLNNDEAYGIVGPSCSKKEPTVIASTISEKEPTAIASSSSGKEPIVIASSGDEETC